MNAAAACQKVAYGFDYPGEEARQHPGDVFHWSCDALCWK